MKGTDYPIEHFELMTRVANHLNSVEIQMLEQEYHYTTFGSWWFVIQIKGENFRILWDGRDEVLMLDADKGFKAPFGYEWIDWLTVPIDRGSNADFLYNEITKLIGKAKAARLATSR